MSSTINRRQRYQSQLTNASSTLSQSFSNAPELVNLNDSFSTAFSSLTPLVTIIYSTASKENQQLLLNSYSSCRRFLDHMKPIVGVPFDEMIDLMDNEGKVKDLNAHADEYASQYLTARNTYYVLKIENDTTGEKRYVANFNLEQLDQKLISTFTNSLNALNKSSTKVKRFPGGSKQNQSNQAASNAAQAKTRRISSKK